MGVELPLAGDSAPGHLILSPGDLEAENFVRFPAGQLLDATGSLNNAIEGCLTDQNDGERLCGSVLFDSGQDDVLVIRHGLPKGEHARFTIWGTGTTGVFRFSAAKGKVVKAVEGSFAAAQGAGPNKVVVQVFPGRTSALDIDAGAEPYLLFSVLYDYLHGQIGLWPR